MSRENQAGMSATLRATARRAIGLLPVGVTRSYVRYAPTTLGKAVLADRVLEGALQERPRRFIARAQWGGRFEGTTEDVIDRYIYEFGVWEPTLTRWLGSRLRPGDLFVDVGSNIGYFTLLASRAVGPEGSVVAVEASPSTFRLLLRNLELNRVSNVRAVNVAASSTRGTLTVHEGPAHNRGLASTVADRGATSTAEVTALPLQEILSEDELRRARVIKLDTEGGELAIMQALLPSLDLMREDVEIVAELDPAYFSYQGHSVDELVDPLRERGFRLYRLQLDYRPAAHVARSVDGPTECVGSVTAVSNYIFSRAQLPAAGT